MGSTNLVVLLGNLGNDPDVRFTNSGTAVANFSLATNEKWKDKQGKPQERTEWHRVVVWGKQAEACGQFLAKGRQCQVIGKLSTREWTDKENKKQWTTEVVANQVVFVGSAPSNRRPEPPPAGDEQAPAGKRSSAEDDFGPPPPGFDQAGPTGGPTEDDIPF